MKYIRIVSFYFCLFFSIHVATGVQSGESHHDVSFAVLYPMTSYKKVLHACMHAWQCVCDVAEGIVADEYEVVEQMCHAVLGYVTYAYDMVASYVHDKKGRPDQYAYLAYVCNRIADEYNRVSHDALAGVHASLKNKIRQMQKLFTD